MKKYLLLFISASTFVASASARDLIFFNNSTTGVQIKLSKVNASERSCSINYSEDYNYLAPHSYLAFSYYDDCIPTYRAGIINEENKKEGVAYLEGNSIQGLNMMGWENGVINPLNPLNVFFNTFVVRHDSITQSVVFGDEQPLVQPNMLGLLPHGSYLGSCSKFMLNTGSSTLKAYCVNNRREENITEINYSSCKEDTIWNDNGYLKCEK